MAAAPAPAIGVGATAIQMSIGGGPLQEGAGNPLGEGTETRGTESSQQTPNPTITRLHPDSTLSKASLDFWRKQSTEDILQSLGSGKLKGANVGELVVNAEGKILNGNTRVKVLEERGFDISKLQERLKTSFNTAKENFNKLFKD